MPRFKVTVNRTGYACTTIEVDVDSVKEAKGKALEVAGNVSFSEHDAVYDVEAVERVSDGVSEKATGRRRSSRTPTGTGERAR